MNRALGADEANEQELNENEWRRSRSWINKLNCPTRLGANVTAVNAEKTKAFLLLYDNQGASNNKLEHKQR